MAHETSHLHPGSGLAVIGLRYQPSSIPTDRRRRLCLRFQAPTMPDDYHQPTLGHLRTQGRSYAQTRTRTSDTPDGHRHLQPSLLCGHRKRVETTGSSGQASTKAQTSEGAAPRCQGHPCRLAGGQRQGVKEARRWLPAPSRRVPLAQPRGRASGQHGGTLRTERRTTVVPPRAPLHRAAGRADPPVRPHPSATPR